MPTTKKEQISFVVIVTLCIGSINLLSNQLPKIWSSGASHAKVEQVLANAIKEIHRIDDMGCGPSIDVRRDVEGMKKEDKAHNDRLQNFEIEQRAIRKDVSDIKGDVKTILGRIQE